MLFSLMQVLCMHTVATPTMQIHIGVVTVVDHNLFGLACLVTFSLNASRIREHGSVSLCRDGQKTKWRLQCKY